MSITFIIFHCLRNFVLQPRNDRSSSSGLNQLRDPVLQFRDKDREIARLKTDTTSASVMASRVSCPLPDAAEHGPCEAARFLTIADAARLSQASSFHFGHLQDLHIEVDAP